MSYFSVKNLTAGYEKNKVIENISFESEKGTILGIIGANGSGKTTLLKSICGILPYKGSCCLENNKLDGLSAKKISKLISYIPQRSGITIDISVLDVVLMGFNPQLGILEHPNKDMESKTLEALTKLDLPAGVEINIKL